AYPSRAGEPTPTRHPPPATRHPPPATPSGTRHSWLPPTMIATQTRHGRALAAQNLARVVSDAGVPVSPATDVATALHLAFNRAEADDVILVTGSLFLVAEAREALGIAAPEPLPPR